MFEFRDDCAAAVDELLANCPARLLDKLEVERPGVRMLSVLDHLREEILSDADRERVLGVWDRLLAWTQLRRAEAVAGAASPQHAVAGPFGTDDFGPEIIALITGQTLNSAGTDLHTARTVLSNLPGVRSALERGGISWLMARAVVDATAGLEPWQVEQVDQAMVDSWEINRDVTAWRRKLRREVIKADTAAAEAKRQRAIRGRRIESWPLPDGMAAVYAELRAEDAKVVMNSLTEIADQYGASDRQQVKSGRLDQIRTVDQRRADALADLCAGAVTDRDLPSSARARVTVQVTGGIKTLLGLRNDPGELAGYGPITAEHLRELAAEGEWQRFCTAEDTGALIAIGRASYRPNKVLRDFMLGVRPNCDYPGCSIPSSRCDGEHTVPHDVGGPSDETNVCPRCRRHHRCKTHAGWTVRTLPNGYLEWTTPAGSSRIVAPYRLAGDDPDDPDDSTSPAAYQRPGRRDSCPPPPTNSRFA